MRRRLPLHAPSPPFSIVLVEPDIPSNTGNIARTCAATGTPLHLIEPLGFRLTDKALKRAGLDYWDAVEMHRHVDFQTFLEKVKPPRFFCFSTRGAKAYTDVEYRPGDALVFGSETRGLNEELLRAHPGELLAIPMKEGTVRSLNLATAVGIVLYEALRQSGV
ncbi:MAG: tRNA (cytidine(34)-2'-O)-methyltransferase [Phycisphaerae bacterium]|nr:tRNA (cytidine(34)-2'-O)-methyltransferase [Phycisphaerae bacterium]